MLFLTKNLFHFQNVLQGRWVHVIRGVFSHFTIFPFFFYSLCSCRDYAQLLNRTKNIPKYLYIFSQTMMIKIYFCFLRISYAYIYVLYVCILYIHRNICFTKQCLSIFIILFTLFYLSTWIHTRFCLWEKSIVNA